MTRVLGDQQLEDVVYLLRTKPFSITVAESTDKSCEKVLCLICVASTVTNYSRTDSRCFSEIGHSGGGNGRRIVQNSRGIFFVVENDSDAANVMQGKHNSVVQKLSRDCRRLKIRKPKYLILFVEM